MTCEDCIHYDICLGAFGALVGHVCDSFKDKSKFIELPCSVGDPYFTIERFCTEGGYHKEKAEVNLSDCEYCCEECDRELRIVEHQFYNNCTILQKEQYIDKTVFLTREEAEKKLEELNNARNS